MKNRLPNRALVFGVAWLACSAAAWADKKDSTDKSLVDRGRYLAVIAGCNDCHTPGFLQNAGKVVSRKAILEDVWGLHEDTDTRAIDNFIVRLRRFLNEDPSNPRHVITVRGRGYRFIAEPDDLGRTEAPGAVTRPPS